MIEINQLKTNTMIPKLSYKIQILEERYREYCNNSEDGKGDGMSIHEYINRESENDPNFFSWLYDETSGSEIPEQDVDKDMENLLAMF